VNKKKELREMKKVVEEKMWNRMLKIWENVKIEIDMEFDEKGRMKYSERRI
jgi:predicted nucleic acid-binding protein